MWLRHAKAVFICGCLVTYPTVARAEASSCATAYERAQELRAEGHLRDAHRTLEACVQPTCSAFVSSECGRWLSEVESSLPSVVIIAKNDGKETEIVSVFYDDELLVESLDGKAVAVDPGQHTLKLLVEGGEPTVVKLVIREGEKNRQIVVELGRKARQTPPAVAEQPPTSIVAPTQRTNWVPYALSGLGVLGVTGFVVLGVMGNHELAERERTCAPSCSDSEVGTVRTKYHLADLSLGIGVVSLGVAGYLFIASPRGTTPTATAERKMRLDVHLTQGGGFAAVRARF